LYARTRVGKMSSINSIVETVLWALRLLHSKHRVQEATPDSTSSGIKWWELKEIVSWKFNI
jgi:hypothetical protein